MNPQTFEPFDSFDQPAAAPSASADDPSPFFDRAGLAWIAACAAIAVAAGHWIPPLAEPGAWRDMAQAASPALPASAATGMAKRMQPHAVPVADEERRPGKTTGKLPMGML